MPNLQTDSKYKSANEIPFAFIEGDIVAKEVDDYTFKGMVISVFRKRSGSPRYVVENAEGIVHIFKHNQLYLVQQGSLNAKPS